MSDLVDIANLEMAKAETEPFPFLVVEKFLDPSGIEGLVRDFPAISEPRNHSLAGLEYGPNFAQLLDELARPEWVRMLGEKLGVPNLGEFSCNISLRAYGEASDGNIHPDHRSKVVTALIYLNQEWTSKTMPRKCHRSPGPCWPSVAQIGPSMGTTNSWDRGG